MAVDWIKVKNEYTSGHISYRKLAGKYAIPYPTIRDRAKKEGWSGKRDTQRTEISERTYQKTVEAVSSREASRIDRILSAADLLLARVEEAARQLDTHIVTNKTKTKTVKYNGANKPTKEVIVEEELKAVVPGPVDRLGLQQVAAALKSIKETIRVEDVGESEAEQTENTLALADVIRSTAPNRNIEDYEGVEPPIED